MSLSDGIITSGTCNWYFVPDTADDYLPCIHPQQPKAEVSIHYNLQREEVKREMKGLYRVIAVDYKNETVVVDEEVIANSEENARLVALADIVSDYDVDELDIKVIKIMDIRKVPEPQRIVIEK